MAELTNLETKLGEVIGLAMAAQDATKKVSRLAKKEKHDDLVADARDDGRGSREAEQRATEIAEPIEGKKTAILKEARSVKTKAREMMSTYLDDDADALDGFEFLTMAEASEVGHWTVLEQLNEKARHPRAAASSSSSRSRSSSGTCRTPWRDRSSSRREEDPNEPS